MNRIFVLICLVGFSFYSSVVAQAYEVSYKVKAYINKEERKPISKFSQLVLDQIDSLEMTLLFNDERAIFKRREKLMMTPQEEKIFKLAHVSTTGVTHTYFLNLKDQELFEIKEMQLNDPEYIVKSKYDSIKWKYSNEKKVINGFECYKAISIEKFVNRHGITHNLEITAWYAKNLPYSFGPKKYGGLPGLILELHEGYERFSYFALEIIPKPLEDMSFIFPEGKMIIKEEFDKLFER